VKDLEKVVADLETNGISFHKNQMSDMIKRYLLQSPMDNVSLVTFVDGFTQPPGQPC